jgi:uridine kinase
LIIDIRGTNGSGKSHIVHELMKEFPHQCIVDESIDSPGHIEGYEFPSLRLFVAGPYATQCGGCDGIHTQAEICDIVKRRSQQWDVLLEGLLVSHTFTRWFEMSRKIPDWKFFFLDTPLQVCIDRCIARRLAAGNTKEFNPTHLTDGWYSCHRVEKKFIQARCNVTSLNYRRAYEIIRAEILSRPVLR